MLGYPVGFRRDFVTRIKHELKQIPKDKKGVIIYCPIAGFDKRVGYAFDLLNRNTFDNILAIIIWYKDDYRIVARENISSDLLRFLRVPFCELKQEISSASS